MLFWMYRRSSTWIVAFLLPWNIVVSKAYIFRMHAIYNFDPEIEQTFVRASWTRTLKFAYEVTPVLLCDSPCFVFFKLLSCWLSFFSNVVSFEILGSRTSCTCTARLGDNKAAMYSAGFFLMAQTRTKTQSSRTHTASLWVMVDTRSLTSFLHIKTWRQTKVQEKIIFTRSRKCTSPSSVF